MKVSKNSKYQTDKKSSETFSKNPNDQTGAPGGAFRIFNHPLLQNIKKIERRTLWGKFFPGKKSHNAAKTEREDTLVSPGIGFYKEEKEKRF